MQCNTIQCNRMQCNAIQYNQYVLSLLKTLHYKGMQTDNSNLHIHLQDGLHTHTCILTLNTPCVQVLQHRQLFLLLLHPHVMLYVQDSVDDETRRLQQGGKRSAQLLREVHNFGPSLTSVLVCWAVSKKVSRSSDAGATGALVSV